MESVFSACAQMRCNRTIDSASLRWIGQRKWVRIGSVWWAFCKELVMRQIRQGGVQKAASLVISLCLAVSLTISPQSSDGQVNGENPRIRQGQFPPDFELPRLTLTTDETGKTVGVINENNTIRLSSFRGKRPVCLIMSSYT